MNQVSKISSTAPALRRRLPLPFNGIETNFCRNPRCDCYGIHPDPYDRRGRSAPPDVLRGVVGGRRHEEYFKCPSCGSTNRLKNNKAIAEEYARLRGLQQENPHLACCRTSGCPNEQQSVAHNPKSYHLFGRTKSGDQRYRCKGCGRTFSIGKPTRRQKRSDKNHMLYSLLVNGMPLSKIAVVLGLNYGDIYRKIDFIHQQAQAFIARRECFSSTDWLRVGSSFATDSQSLTLNWPTRRERTPVIVQHLCTAHARSGFIMEAALQFDPSTDVELVQAQMDDVDDGSTSRCFQENGRVWSKNDFQEYLGKLQKQKRVQDTELYQLPHTGALVRFDVLQFAHALRVRDMIGDTDASLFFAVDGDAGLRAAFCAAFVTKFREETAHMALITFDKGMSNDERRQLVAEGRRTLADATGVPVAQQRKLSDEDFAALVDAAVEPEVAGADLAQGFDWPIHSKSEPGKRVQLITHSPSMSPGYAAKLLRRATLRSVDAYFHKVRSNLRFAARPQVSETNGRKTWDRYYLYKPEMMAKLIAIYRFHHNWVGDGRKDTPAMRIGLARGRIYERDFL